MRPLCGPGADCCPPDACLAGVRVAAAARRSEEESSSTGLDEEADS